MKTSYSFKCCTFCPLRSLFISQIKLGNVRVSVLHLRRPSVSSVPFLPEKTAAPSVWYADTQWQNSVSSL